MLPFLLLLGQTSMGEVAGLRPPTPVRIAPAERWTITPVATPKQAIIDPTKPRRIQVGKATVTISPTASFGEIDEIQRGADGSLCIRRVSRQSAWAQQSSIWFAGKEAVVPNLDIKVYLDRRTYAGSMSTDTGGQDAFIVEKARKRAVGPGLVNYWRPGGPVFLSVFVDAGGRPTMSDERETISTRILDGKRAIVFPRSIFMGRSDDGSLFLTQPSGGIVRYRPNGNPSHWRLPTGWRMEGIFPNGDVMLRYAPITPMPALPRDGADMEEWSKRMHQWKQTVTAEADVNERSWSAAILREGILYPIQFPRPPKTENLRWRDAPILGSSAFRFTAFLNDERKSFRVTAPK